MSAALLFVSALLFQERPQQPTTPPAAPVFVVAGTVVDAASKAPLARARIMVQPIELGTPEPGVRPTRRPSRSAITGADGTFGFLNVPAGKYQLSASMPNHNPQLYLSEGDQYSTAIVTGPGIDTTRLVFPFHTGGAITGIVADENGEPVRPQVHLFRKAILDGRERVVQAGGPISNSGSSFHFSHLQPGTYYVAISAEPWYATRTANFDSSVAYPLTYYPSTTDFASASPITVADGSSSNIQISMRAVPTVHVNFLRAKDENGSPQMTASNIMAVGPGGFLVPTMNFLKPNTLTGLAPGNYSIQTATGRDNPQQTRQLIHVTGDANIELASPSSPSVSGKISIEDGAKPGNRIVIALSENSLFSNAQVKEDGTFDFKDRNLGAGRYRLLLPNNPLFYIKSVTATGSSLADGELDLKENSSVQLNVVLAQAAQAGVEGIAVRNGVPQPGAMVLLLPVKSSGADLVRRDQSDLDGSFALRGVPPGEYHLIAIDHGHDLGYRDQNAIRPYLAKARTVTIGSGAPSTAAAADLKVEVQTRAAK